MNLLQKLVLIASATLPLHAQQCDAMERFGQSLPLWKQILQADPDDTTAASERPDRVMLPLAEWGQMFVDAVDDSLWAANGMSRPLHQIILFGVRLDSVRDLGPFASAVVQRLEEWLPRAAPRVDIDLAASCQVPVTPLLAESDCGCGSSN